MASWLPLSFTVRWQPTGLHLPTIARAEAAAIALVRLEAGCRWANCEGVRASHPGALRVRLAGIPLSAGGQRADVLGYRHRRAVRRSRGITRRGRLAAGTGRTGPQRWQALGRHPRRQAPPLPV